MNNWVGRAAVAGMGWEWMGRMGVGGSPLRKELFCTFIQGSQCKVSQLQPSAHVKVRQRY